MVLPGAGIFVEDEARRRRTTGRNPRRRNEVIGDKDQARQDQVHSKSVQDREVDAVDLRYALPTSASTSVSAVRKNVDSGSAAIAILSWRIAPGRSPRRNASSALR